MRYATTGVRTAMLTYQEQAKPLRALTRPIAGRRSGRMASGPKACPQCADPACRCDATATGGQRAASTAPWLAATKPQAEARFSQDLDAARLSDDGAARPPSTAATPSAEGLSSFPASALGSGAGGGPSSGGRLDKGGEKDPCPKFTKEAIARLLAYHHLRTKENPKLADRVTFIRCGKNLCFIDFASGANVGVTFAHYPYYLAAVTFGKKQWVRCTYDFKCDGLNIRFGPGECYQQQ